MKITTSVMSFANVLYRPFLSVLLFVVAGGVASYATFYETKFSRITGSLLGSLFSAPIETLDFIVYWGISWLFEAWYLAFAISLFSLGFLFQNLAMRMAGIIAVILFGLATLQFAFVGATYDPSTGKLPTIEIISLAIFTFIFTAVYAFAITRFRSKL